jgi:23S rRNA A2030 N6-methylase RlmJ
MNTNIDQILEKYWNAETSLQEEAELRSYFSSDHVAPEHEQFKDLFIYFSASRLQTTDLDVEHILSSVSHDDIDDLLEKYWNVETSIEEENQLKKYFSSGSVSANHEQYKDLFAFFEVQGSQKSDTNIEMVMNEQSDIDELLNRYWSADASLEEEKLLHQYFASNLIEKRHLPYLPMFQLFSTKAKETSDLNIDEVLNRCGDKLENKTIGSSNIKNIGQTKVLSLQKWVVGLAAIFVLAFGAITLMQQTNSKTQYKGRATVLDEEAEAQEAYEITKEALAFLSKNINKGSDAVVKSVSKAEKVKIFK